MKPILITVLALAALVPAACGEDPADGPGNGAQYAVKYFVSSTSAITNVTYRDVTGAMVTVNPSAAAWSNMFTASTRPFNLQCSAVVYGTAGMWMPGPDPMGPMIWMPMMDTMSVIISVDGSNVAFNTANVFSSAMTCTTNHYLP